MTDPEYEAAVHLAASLAFTARMGPSYDETKNFPLWKRALIKVTPTRQRWRFSQYAPLLRERRQYRSR